MCIRDSIHAFADVIAEHDHLDQRQQRVTVLQRQPHHVEEHDDRQHLCKFGEEFALAARHHVCLLYTSRCV